MFVQTLRARRLTACATLVAALTAALTACGGSDGDPADRYSRLVAFGDSLSDVGSYATPGVLAFGGRRYTVNSPTARNWVELLAEEAGVAAPCAAITGLESSGSLAGLAGPITDHPACTGYAQGGARVTEPIGPGNKALLPNEDGELGQLTQPLVQQVERHLNRNAGKFAANELVTVLAGGNDLFMQAALVEAAATTPTDAVNAMQAAGGQLATLVKARVVGNGARRVVVVNLPDVSLTPYALAAEASAPGTQTFVNAMTQAFNAALAAGLTGVDGVLFVDAYTRSQDQARNPAAYGLTNVTQASCLEATGTALLCNSLTVIAGDVSQYQYADDVHPSPLGYQLLARFVAAHMVTAGWL